MALKMQGGQSVKFENPPVIKGAACVVSDKEGSGPFGQYFDVVHSDAKVGEDTWEAAEAKLQKEAAEVAMNKAMLKKKDIRYIVAGDLLGQLMASSFGLRDMEIPLFGVYGACSTMGESLGIASMIIDGGYADNVMAITSSHFASAEKQFRFPLGYGNQRPKAATWTVTGSGAIVLSASGKSDEKIAFLESESGEKDAKGNSFLGSKSGKKNKKKRVVKITGITTGKVIDFGIKDSMNMGACMAPAAGDVIYNNFVDFGYKPADYDKIITGDLGKVGKDILVDFLRAKNYDIEDRYMDCGIEIYGSMEQTQAGGSGCGCSAVMLAGYILKMLENGEWKRVLFVPTGALLSQVSFNEGNTVPSIAHAVVFESEVV